MSAVAKKPRERDSTTPSSSPSRVPPRSSTPSSSSSSSAAANSSAAGVTRTRSLRSSTPVSARTVAHQRRDSRLMNSITPADAEREDAARAETIALLDDLKERLAKAEGASEQYKKQAEVLQSRLDEALKEQARLEEKVHENEEQLETLRNERREAARQMREMEAIYEAERSAMTKEKEDMANREEEMQAVIQRLKDSLAQRAANGDDEPRPSRQSQNNSPSVDNGSFAPPSSIHRSDSRNNSKLLLQKDKLIESLRLELAEAQIKLVESENQGGGRLHEVERLLMEARMANARLMEDNESYQLLLQEKTLKGDFATSDFSYMGGAAANQDALNALEGRSGSGGGTSLADELSEAAESEGENYRRLEAEVRSLKDQNKALTLYINKIIERLLQHQDYEHILDQSSDFKVPDTNKELPPPPNKQPTGQWLLSQVKSVGASVTASKPQPRPRPMSVMPSAGINSALTNPDTAPSIPIGLTRSTSVRRGRPMSEQYTAGGSGAASIVNAMYRGMADGGPISPTLRGPTNSFFASPGSAPSPTGVPGSRVSSGAGARPTSGNFPGMRSETSSTSGDSVANASTGAGSGGDVSTPPSQSPPRPDKDKATTLAGNKPRPLRLVQENSEVAGKADTAANRRSIWAAWPFGAKKEEGGGLGSPDSTRE